MEQQPVYRTCVRSLDIPPPLYILYIQYRSKKVNVSTVRYAPGALLVRLRFALGTLLVRSSLVVLRCGSVRFSAVGAVRSAYYRLCAHA